MSKPSDYILSSDYASLANDATGDASVTFPGAQAVAANGGVTTFSSSITLGSVGSSTRWRIASSKDADTWFIGATLQYTRYGTVSGVSGQQYTISATVTKTSPTQVKVLAVVLNPYSAILTTESGDETFQFHINTFIPPFA